MTVEELKEMINSTIVENGKAEITGNSLNLALNSIIETFEKGVGSGSGATCEKLIVCKDTLLSIITDGSEEAMMNLLNPVDDPAVLEHNRAVFEKVKHSLEGNDPIIVKTFFGLGTYNNLMSVQTYSGGPVMLQDVEQWVDVMFFKSEDLYSQIEGFPSELELLIGQVPVLQVHPMDQNGIVSSYPAYAYIPCMFFNNGCFVVIPL